MYAIKRAERPPQTLVHFVTALASLFTDQRTSNLPIRAAYKHCGDNLRAYFWQVSNWFQFLLCEVMVVQARSWDSVQRLSFYLPNRDTSQRTFSHDFPYRMTTRQFLREVSPTMVIIQLLQQKFVIRTFLTIHQWWSRLVCIHVEYIPNARDQEMMLVLQDPPVSLMSSTWETSSAFFFQPF